MNEELLAELRQVAPPRLDEPLSAGAARVALAPALPVVRAGYPPPRPLAQREHDPLEARALVVAGGGKRVALALVDLLMVPEALTQAASGRLSDLGLDALIVIATHTHSSVGAFDRQPLAQLAGTGRFDERVQAHLADRIAQAVRAAAADLQPVSLWRASQKVPGLVLNRSSPGGEIDDALTTFALRSASGQPVATVVVAAAHPTTFPREAAELSADVPGEVMRRVETRGGVAFWLQGAVGDTTLADPPDGGGSRFDFAVARLTAAVMGAQAEARSAPGGVAYAEAEVGLPPPSADAAVPGWLRRPAANLLALWAARTARVGALRLGDALLLTVPAEATGAAATALKRRVAGHTPDDAHVAVVSLSQGYLGYAETPERVRAREGEARRTYYGPQFIGRLGDGLVAAVNAVR